MFPLNLDKETFDLFEKINNCESENIGDLGKIIQATPKQIEKFIGEYLCNDFELKNMLKEYKTQISNYLDSVIADNRSYLNKEKQMEIYWNSIFQSKNDLIYSKK